MITTAHLCAGYDGLGRGLALLGPTRTLWHAERDEGMATVLAKHEPGVINVGDIITLPWHLAPVPDVVTAGIPCQPISGAGRGLGEDDERYLWPDARKGFEIMRPRHILLENVQRLVSMRNRDGSSMLAGWLADLRALRYEVRWTVIGACAVGAPHHRHRFYAWATYVPSGPVPEAIKIHTPCGAPRSGGRVLLPTPRASDGTHGGPSQRGSKGDLAMPSACQPETWGRYAQAVALWEQITGVPAPEPTEPNTKGGRRMSPLLPEWMMGLSPGTLTGVLGRNAAIKGAGNGAVPLQAAAAVRLLSS